MYQNNPNLQFCTTAWVGFARVFFKYKSVIGYMQVIYKFLTQLGTPIAKIEAPHDERENFNPSVAASVT